MTEKVVLTKEQAEAIEENLQRGWALSDMVSRHIGGWESGFRTCLNSLDIDDFIRALYIGYEVEPEFSEGDWIAIKHYKETIIKKVVGVENENQVYLEDAYGRCNVNDIRHATPSEIAEEKERRWWKKHGRDVWELKKGDLLKNTHNYLTYEVVDVNEKGGISFVSDIGFRDKNSIVATYKVACFIENRLDVKTDD